MSEPERFKDTERNVILNKASMDLWDIVSNSDPETDHLGNKVWDRLDKLALEIEMRCRADLVKYATAYMAAVNQMNAAIKDGINVHGAISDLIGAEDMLAHAIQNA